MGSFGISEDNITGRKKKKKKKNPHIMQLAAIPSGEVDRTLVSASSEQGPNREAWASPIGWGPGLNALRTI